VKKRLRSAFINLPEVEHRVQHLGERRHISRDINFECSQLIEVVGASDINVVSDRDFITLIDLRNAECPVY